MQRGARQLEAQGLVNHWEGRILRRRLPLEGVDVRIWVGVTAATEHFTAGFGDVPINPDTGMLRLKSAGDWAQEKTGSVVVGGVASAGAAVGLSFYEAGADLVKGVKGLVTDW